MQAIVKQQRIKEVDIFYTGNIVIHKTDGQVVMVCNIRSKGGFTGTVLNNVIGKLDRGNVADYDRKDYEQFYGTLTFKNEIKTEL